MYGIFYLLIEHPGLVLKMFLGTLVGFALLVWAVSPSQEDRMAYQAEIEARHLAELNCRKSGGSFEYFGTQGYHCIGGKE